MQEAQRLQQGQGDEREPAEIDGLAQAVPDRLEAVDVLRAQVEVGVGFELAGREEHLRLHHARLLILAGMLARPDAHGVLLVRLRDEGGEEVATAEAGPADVVLDQARLGRLANGMCSSLPSCRTRTLSKTTSAALTPAGSRPSSHPSAISVYARGTRADIDVDRPQVVVAAQCDPFARHGAAGELAGEGNRFRAVGREIQLRLVDVVDHAGVVELLSGAAQRQAERQACLIGKLHHLQERTLRVHGGAVILELETAQTRARGGEGGAVVGRVDHDVASRGEHRSPGVGRCRCGWHGSGRARRLSGEGGAATGGTATGGVAAPSAGMSLGG